MREILDVSKFYSFFLNDNLSTKIKCSRPTLKSSVINYSLNSKEMEEFAYDYARQLGAPLPKSIPLSPFSISTACGGATLLFGAFFYAVQKKLGRPIRIACSTPPPYYYIFKDLCSIMSNMEWVDWETIFPENIDIVVIVSPSVPLGVIGDLSTLPYIPPYILADFAYDNSAYTGEEKSVNSWAWEIVQKSTQKIGIVSSFSKSGFAGAREGYLFYNDVELKKDIAFYIRTIVFGNSTIGFATIQKNACFITISFLKDMYKVLSERHIEIQKLISSEYILNTFNTIVLFVKIPPNVFYDIGILVRQGSVYFVSDEYSALNIFLDTEDWNKLVQRLKLLPPLYRPS